MQELLKDLAARNDPLTFGDQPLDCHLRVELVRMRTSDEVHRDVRVDEDPMSPPPPIPPSISARRPASISASIVSMSTSRPSVSRLTALRIAASLASTLP